MNQPDKATRRRRGRTDTIDAEAAAHAVLSGRATATAKLADGPVEVLRVFKMAKVCAVKARTQAINQLRPVLVTASPELRESLDRLTIPTLVRACTTLHRSTAGTATAAAGFTLRLPEGGLHQPGQSESRSPSRRLPSVIERGANSRPDDGGNHGKDRCRRHQHRPLLISLLNHEVEPPRRAPCAATGPAGHTPPVLHAIDRDQAGTLLPQSQLSSSTRTQRQARAPVPSN